MYTYRLYISAERTPDLPLPDKAQIDRLLDGIDRAFEAIYPEDRIYLHFNATLKDELTQFSRPNPLNRDTEIRYLDAARIIFSMIYDVKIAQGWLLPPRAERARRRRSLITTARAMIDMLGGESARWTAKPRHFAPDLYDIQTLTGGTVAENVPGAAAPLIEAAPRIIAALIAELESAPADRRPC